MDFMEIILEILGVAAVSLTVWVAPKVLLKDLLVLEASRETNQ